MGTTQDKLVYLNKYKKEFIKVLNNKGILLRQDATLSQVMYSVYFYYKIRIFDEKMKVWKASYFPLDGHDIINNINLVKLKEAYRTATGRELTITPFSVYNKTSSLDDKFEVMKRWKQDMTNEMKVNPLRTSAINTDASLDNMVKEFMKELDFVIPPLKIPEKIKKIDGNQEVHFKDAQPNMVVNMEGQDFPYRLDEGIKGIAKPHPAKFKIPVVYKTKYGKVINQGFITIQGNLDWSPEVYMFNRGKLFTGEDNRKEVLMANMPNFFNMNEEAFGLYLKFPEEIERKIEDEGWTLLLGIFEVNEKGEPNYFANNKILYEYIDKYNYRSNLLAPPNYRMNEFGMYEGMTRMDYGTLQEGHVFYRSSRFPAPLKGKYQHESAESVQLSNSELQSMKAYMFGSDFASPNSNAELRPDTKFTLFSEENSGSKIAIQIFQLSRKVNLPITDISQYAWNAFDSIMSGSRDGGPSLFDRNDSTFATEPIIVDCEKATIKNAPYYDPDNIPVLQKLEDDGSLLFGFDDKKDDWRMDLFFAALIGISVPYVSKQDPSTGYMLESTEMYPNILSIDTREPNSARLIKTNDGRNFLKIPASYYIQMPEQRKFFSKYATWGPLQKLSIKFHFRNHIFKNDTFLNNEKMPFTGDKKILKIHRGQIIKLFTSHFVHPSDLRHYRDLMGFGNNIKEKLYQVSDEQKRNELYDPVNKMMKQYYTGGFNTESIVINGEPLRLENRDRDQWYVTDGAITTVSVEIPRVVFINRFFGIIDSIEEKTFLSYYDDGTINFPMSLEDKIDLSFLDNKSTNYIDIYGMANAWYWLVYLFVSGVSEYPVNFFYRGPENTERLLRDVLPNVKEDDVRLIKELIRPKVIDWLKAKRNEYFEKENQNIVLTHTDGGHPLLRAIKNGLCFIYSIRDNRELDYRTFGYAMQILRPSEFSPFENIMEVLFSFVSKTIMNEQEYTYDAQFFRGRNKITTHFTLKNGKTLRVEYRHKNDEGTIYTSTLSKNYKTLSDTPDNPFMGYSYPANYTPTNDKQREQIEKYTHILYYDMTWKELVNNRGDVDINSIARKYPGLVDETKHGEKSIIIRVFIDKKNNGTALVPNDVPTVDFEGGKYPDYNNNTFWDKYGTFCNKLRDTLLKENRYFKNVICLMLGVGIDNTGYDYANKKYIRYIGDQETLRNRLQVSVPTLTKAPGGFVKNFWVSFPMLPNTFNNTLPSGMASTAVLQNLVVFNAPLGDKTKFEEWVDACYLGTKKMIDNDIHPHLGKYDENRKDILMNSNPLKCSNNKYTIGTLPDNVNDLIENEEYFAELLRQFKTINPMFVIGFIDRERHPEKYQLLLNEMGYKIGVSGTIIQSSVTKIFLENTGKNPYYTFNTKSRLVPRMFVKGRKTGITIVDMRERTGGESGDYRGGLIDANKPSITKIDFVPTIYPEGTFVCGIDDRMGGNINRSQSKIIEERMKEDAKFDSEDDSDTVDESIWAQYYTYTENDKTVFHMDYIFKLSVSENYDDSVDRLYIKLANHVPNTTSLNVSNIELNLFLIESFL